MGRFFTASRAWAAGRWWQWRVPLLLFLGWDGLRHLRDPEAGGLFAGITFGVHEFGHLLFAAFGEFLGIAGGSLTQLLIPVLTGALLYHHRDYFGLSAAGAWLASSLLDLARYIADARVGDLALASFSEESVHDWTWLLGRMGWLQHDLAIARTASGLGLLVLLTALLYGAWLCLAMRAPAPPAGVTPA